MHRTIKTHCYYQLNLQYKKENSLQLMSSHFFWLTVIILIWLTLVSLNSYALLTTHIHQFNMWTLWLQSSVTQRNEYRWSWLVHSSCVRDRSLITEFYSSLYTRRIRWRKKKEKQRESYEHIQWVKSFRESNWLFI
jgi:hypothetical protein